MPYWLVGTLLAFSCPLHRLISLYLTIYNRMLDFRHLKEVDQNYVQHMLFALLICLRVSFAMGLLLIHAFLPFIKMPNPLDIARTSDYLFDKDYETRVRMMKVMDKNVSDTK